MTTEVISQTVTAGALSTFGGGRLWYVKSATAPLTIITETKGTGGSIRKFTNIPAGAKFRVREGSPDFTYLRVTSAVTQNIELVIGDDDVEFSNAVSVTGGVSTNETPSSVVTDAPAVALPNAATTAIVPVNAARKRVTISNPSTATASFFVRAAGGANNLLEIQPGMFAEFKTAAGLSGRNDSGGALSALVLEET